MKKTVRRAGAAFCLIGVLLTFLLRWQEDTYGGVYDNTVRLHILADSDDPHAQAQKLRVRDAVVGYLQTALAVCEKKEEAEQRVRALLPEIEDCCRAVLEAEGSSLGVEVSLGEEHYPRREYEQRSYPAGEYCSLQVRIGRAEGQNWWCVVYPPLCLGASQAGQGSYTSEQEELLARQKGYKVRFALLEWGRSLMDLF